MQRIAGIVVRMARDNPSWGYERIVGALAHLGHRVAPNTVKKILKAHGIDPAPERANKTSWRRFLRIHLNSMVLLTFSRQVAAA